MSTLVFWGGMVSIVVALGLILLIDLCPFGKRWKERDK
jgi:hypothetical protein